MEMGYGITMEMAMGVLVDTITYNFIELRIFECFIMNWQYQCMNKSKKARPYLIGGFQR